MRKQQASGRVDAGARGAVTGGAQMGQMTALLVDILEEAGLSRIDIHTDTALELPGYYRAEKKWDLLVVSEGELLAAVELKSQVGPSFGNNFNNRSEEAIGSATCLWTAYREGRFGNQQRPFLGYLFLLEDCPQVHKPVKVKQPHFVVDKEFVDASYGRRYELLCRRLVRERLYDAACFSLATNGTPSLVAQPADDLTFKHFVIALQERVRSFLRARA
ncbi:restriction endonuclease [Myxococcota bacterium]|nr:restriction endonuclease [Myxococcota bacterium]